MEFRQGGKRLNRTAPGGKRRIAAAADMVDRRGPHRQARNRQAADDSQKWIGGQQTSEHEVENHPHQRDDAQQPGIPVDIVIDDGGIGIKVLENRALDELIPCLLYTSDAADEL